MCSIPLSASRQTSVEPIALWTEAARFRFTETISFVVNGETQKEGDHFGEKLSEAEEKGRCGWPKDRDGLSWQIVPTVLGELLSDTDAEKSQRGINALLQMQKLDIDALT
jgi:predicted 3-demethylubiquinone-9 3-methyltransferase (glyoxalase superfamily)